MRPETRKVIIYMSVDYDYKDADDFLKGLKELIGSDKETSLSLRWKTLSTPDCIIEAHPISHASGPIRHRHADYFMMSNKPFETYISEVVSLKYRVGEVNQSLKIGAKEINVKQLLELLHINFER